MKREIQEKVALAPYCNLCGLQFDEDASQEHLVHCAKVLLEQSGGSQDPFEQWKTSVALDRCGRFQESETEFKRAAQGFFHLSKDQERSSKALFEYSMLMDALSKIASGRNLISAGDFTEASVTMTRASEILRSTLHYAFLAPYVTACAMMDGASGLESGDVDAFEAYKSTNALLEQARFALSFMDENHYLVVVIESLLKLSLSRALHSESSSLLAAGSEALSKEKERRSSQLRLEHKYLCSKTGLIPFVLEYFPQRDFNLRVRAPFLIGYPDSENLWIVNVGKNPAIVRKLGNLTANMEIDSMSSSLFPLNTIGRGKIRILFLDPLSGETRESGCLTLV